MAIMFGNGTVKGIGGDQYIMKTEQFEATETTEITTAPTKDVAGWKFKYEGPDGKQYTKVNPKFYGEQDKENVTSLVQGQKYFCSYDLKVEGSVIEISANSFPGSYYVTGDTYARSETTGDDEFFQFIIPKAKVTSENTITLEAEGDPSVFNMSLRVMRPADGKMMKLVKYKLADGVDAEEEALTVNDLAHNHSLEKKTGATEGTGL